ncbi:MAG TPA: PLP-dependent aminotransferase family protein [Roseiflexaceae bacterium]|nr:PLP-dependent aminotransferase family protein [Roseiflexaceae bacterium]
MPKREAAVAPLVLSLDAGAATPLHQQLCSELRRAITGGRLLPGSRLPPTRTLAQMLHLGRSTVLSAFEQLCAEGYLEARVGDGTYVADPLPEDVLLSQALPAVPPATRPPHASRRGLRTAAALAGGAPDNGRPRAFRPCLPDVQHFPSDVWARISARVARHASAALLHYGEPAGYAPLRAQIATYLASARAVACHPDQIIVVAGTQQAIALAAHVLLDEGDTVWVEDPGYPAGRGALLSAGAQLCPVPVDRAGLVVSAGRALAPGARMAMVTPSYQFPLGATMSLTRRRELLAWVEAADAWVFEDDYDSEYRYTERPLPALHGMSAGGRVIYCGTFSKVLFPALRLGYLVVPPGLVDLFAAARALADRHAPTLEQATLAEFMAEGHFFQHLRRMRTRYALRQAALVEAVRAELGGLLAVEPAEGGMHLVGWLPPGTDDRRAAQQALLAGVEAPALSAYTGAPPDRPGVLLGYTAVDEAAIRRGVHVLATVWQAG